MSNSSYVIENYIEITEDIFHIESLKQIQLVFVKRYNMTYRWIKHGRQRPI